MDEGIAGAVADWEQRPFSGGYRGLQDLVDREFSGAVEADGCWLLLINGRIVGAYEEYEGRNGPEQEPVDIERFEGASGTSYEAPYVALPLLVTMRVRGGEVVARDSTQERPLEAVHRDLESEGFTGYLVLSEHVLSGEYYVVYQGGRSMSVAFIGGARRLKTGDEAFERAKKEVGIYEARAVGLQVFEVPEPTGGAAVAGDPDVGDADGDPDAATEAAEPPATTDEADPATDEPTTEDTRVDKVEDALAESEPETDDATTTDEAVPDPARADDTPADAGPVPAAEVRADEPLVEEAESRQEPDEPTAEAAGPDAPEPTKTDAGGESGETETDVDHDEATAADDESEPTEAEPKADAASERDEPAPDRESEDERAPTPAVTDLEREERPPGQETDGEDGQSVDAGNVEATAVEPAGAGDETTDAATPASTPPEAESVARLNERLDRLAAEQTELSATVERLTERLDRVVGGGDGAFEASERRSPAEALAETTLLVRYRSESGATLKAVYEGGGDREALAENLQLEPRTPFDPSETAVDGRRYADFLSDTVEYRFVEWLVSAFPFEVRETGTTSEFRVLYDVLPDVDRATFRQPAADEGGAFDVVLQNRDGAPLVVVTVDERTEPPSRDTAEELIRQASDVEGAQSTLAAAFLVTTSFVDGAALEPVRDATRSRLLSRDRLKSYVNLSSGGFHLCLVEAGNESFHLAVPDL